MDLPERPRLRPLEPLRVRHEGEDMVVLRDPSGLSEQQLLVSASTLVVLRLFDGEHTLRDVQAAILGQYGELLPLETVESVAKAMDDALFLEGTRAESHRERAVAAFRSGPTRPAIHGGVAYPTDPERLQQWFDAFTAGAEPAAAGPSLRGAAAPHIDLRFGGLSNSLVHRAWAERLPDVDTVVVLGTGHQAGDDLFTLTRLDFDTPLGAVNTDVELVEGLAARLGAERAFRGEWLHRAEHSVEFQAIFLALLARRRAAPLRMVPVLVGSVHEFVEEGRTPRGDERMEAFVEGLSAETARLGRNVLVIASIDLAHVGPRYGDARGLEGDEAAALEEADRNLLAHAERGDAEAFFAHNAAEQDQRRICGFSALYTLLRVLPGARGRILRYDQTTFPGTADTVSHCAMLFEDAG